MTAALIIASGKTKSKDAFAPLKMVGSITAAQRVVSIFRRAGIERIVLVCGENESKAEKLAAQMNVIILQINNSTQMLDGVKSGLVYLRDKCDEVLITPVDIPLFSVETVRSLINSGAKAGVPTWNETLGHPLLLSASYFHDILQYNGDSGLFGAVQSTGMEITEIPVSDEGILIDIQKAEEISSYVTHHSLKKLHPEIRTSIAREKSFFDTNAQYLLRLIDEMGTLREACLRMGISYSKGWKLISLMEEQLGFAVIERRQGGKAGGYSSLTPAGRDFLQRYTSFCEEVWEASEDLFHKYFNDWQPN